MVRWPVLAGSGELFAAYLWAKTEELSEAFRERSASYNPAAYGASRGGYAFVRRTIRHAPIWNHCVGERHATHVYLDHAEHLPRDAWLFDRDR